MNIPYGISEDIGFRVSMEDEHAIYDREERSFFSAEIYDGHGGRGPALIAAEMLTPAFLHAWEMEMKKPVCDRRSEADLLREAYLEVDAYIVKKRLEAGTCAVQFYIMGNRFMAANTGDSRAIIGTAEGTVVLTRDHKPDDYPEFSRIRALGDSCLKPYVSPEPRIVQGNLGCENDRAVLACDGVWDVLSPETVIEAARGHEDAKEAAENISGMAKDTGSYDNITVIVLDLRSHTVGLRNKKMKITGTYDRAAENRA